MRRQRQHGFTMIELLVVIFIVGFLVSLAVLAIGNQDKHRVNNEVQRLQMLLVQLRQEAILKDKQYLLRIRADGYEVLRPDDEGEWQVITDDDLYKAHELDDDLEFRVDIDEHDEEGAIISILSSGEMTPFSLIVSSRDQRFQQGLQGDILGHLTRERQGDG